MEEQDTKKAFEAAKLPKVSGSLKVDQDFVSKFDLYKALVNWVEEDDRLEKCIIRNSGTQHAVDFVYNIDGLTEKEESTILHTRFKPYFEKYFGGDFVKGWDYSSDSVIVK